MGEFWILSFLVSILLTFLFPSLYASVQSTNHSAIHNKCISNTGKVRENTWMIQIQKRLLLVSLCKIILLWAESGGKAVLVVKPSEKMAFLLPYTTLLQ